MINKQLEFVVKENSYIINFPTNRQYIAIQNLKAALASNYADLQYMGPEASYAEALVDTAAHLTILCPDLIKDLTKPILDLDLVEGRQLVEYYTNQFRPWYNENLNFVFEANKPKEESKDEAVGK